MSKDQGGEGREGPVDLPNESGAPGGRALPENPEQPPDGGDGATTAEEETKEPVVEYADVVDLKGEAEIRWEKAQRLDSGQGFGAGQEKCAAALKAAQKCFEDREYGLAKTRFEAVIAACDRLLEMDGQRGHAKEARGQAEAAQATAKEAGAEADARVLWANAGLLMGQAGEEFEKRAFTAAQKNWTAAARKYAEAKDAAAGARAEREAKERAAAETRRRAAEEAAAKKAAEEAARQPKAGDAKTVDLGNGVEMDLAWIPAGSFTMGSPAGEANRDSDEGPQRTVRFAQGFWMGRTEVTQAQYERVMGGQNPSNWKDADLPVEQVSWKDAQDFCKEASRILGKEVRLPSEAEWEYACRAGTSTPFHYGDSLDATMANFNGNYPYGNGRKGEDRGRTTAVKSFRPNAWGLYDMHGNVWEWCEDWYHDSYNGAPSDGSPWLSPAGSTRVLRGGSWATRGRYCRSGNRDRPVPEFADINSGFRVVVSR